MEVMFSKNSRAADKGRQEVLEVIKSPASFTFFNDIVSRLLRFNNVSNHNFIDMVIIVPHIILASYASLLPI
jgi:hypothetical protein